MKHLIATATLLFVTGAAYAQIIPPDTTGVTDTAMSEELEEVTVSTTRSSRSIQDIPTRIEFIGGEELDEKANMKPGDIRMLLAESTGIQTQQTSATSANASIRIQGLDGRYTQILKDGFPMYSGAASGLGLLQTPPLDLKQVEVIKGSASTLYGGGAIAGLVNLITKTPTPDRELLLHLNGTSAKGLDANIFYGQRFKRIGTTVFASRNSNAPYDPADIGLTAIPKFTRYVVNPKVFFYPTPRTTVVAGVNGTVETRTGGSLDYIRDGADTAQAYFEENRSKRLSTQLSATHRLKNEYLLTFKNSYSYFNRIISTPGYIFEGAQRTSYTEVNAASAREKLDWVIGANLLTDGFREKPTPGIAVRDYAQTTIGVFAQGILKVSEKLFLEGGLRGDYVFDYGTAVLPRLSVLYKFGPRFSTRLGGGLGYKPPSIFTEESERLQYRRVMPISPSRNQLEKSYGVNWDINYRKSFADGKMTFSINQLFFYTRINNPLLLSPVGTGEFMFRNIDGHIDTRGTESNIKLGYRDFKLFLGYTFTDAGIHTSAGIADQPLTAKHRINAVLMYEVEEKWKAGLEGYYYSPQKLSDGTTGRDYWITGFMVERLWERFSVYINFENFLDARQTRFDRVYTGTVADPQFRDIYAPLDGFVVNGGLKVRL